MEKYKCTSAHCNKVVHVLVHPSIAGKPCIMSIIVVDDDCGLNYQDNFGKTHRHVAGFMSEYQSRKVILRSLIIHKSIS